MSVELTQLRYFRQIARSGSMTGAARSLRVSQPTLSVAVKRLEESFSTTLFQRHRGGVTLTATGAELVRHVDEVTGVLDRAAERISGLDSQLTGSFAIGCHENLGAYFLLDFVREVVEAAPHITLTLHNSASSSVLDAVVARDVHFGIIVNPRPHPDLVMTELFRDAVDVFIAADHDDPGPDESYNGRRGTALEDLNQARKYFESHPVIYPGRVGECLALLERLADHGFQPQRRLNCGDFGMVKSLALGGLGPALLPRRIAADRTPGRLRRLHHELPVFEDSIQLVFHADLHRTRAATFIKDLLVLHGKSMPCVV